MRCSAFPGKTNWFKGNIHTHTTLSDGAVPPEKQIQLYKEKGYDFLAFSDHNTMSVRAGWGNSSFLMLPAWERDILYTPQVKYTHLLGLFPSTTPANCGFRREPGNKELMTDQMLIDQMRAENSFIVICHPVFSRMEPGELLELSNYDAIEIYNNCAERMCHEGHAETIWDMLLRNGRHVLGIACDDTHSHTETDDHFGGWTMVNCDTLTKESVINAFVNGHYYSTMGPAIYDWGLDDDCAYIECSPCNEIHFISYPTRGKANFGKDLCSMSHRLKGNEDYLRVEIIDSNGKKAWTNPIWF